MLRITLPSSEISANVFDQYNLPLPLNGTTTEVSGNLVLLFENEEEAVAYLDLLEDHATGLDSSSPAKPSINALVGAISNDQFVQAYLQ